MNKQLLASLPLVFALLGGTAEAGEWTNENVGSQPGSNGYLSKLAVAPDQSSYAVWLDWTDFDDTQVMLAKSTNRGKTWTAPVSIFSGKAYDNLDVTADADGLHVLLLDFTETPKEEFQFIYYSRSVDGGQTFSTPLRIGTEPVTGQVRIFSDAGQLYVYGQNGNFECTLYSSADGVTWAEAPILPGTNVNNPGLLARGGVVHMSFAAFNAGAEIQYTRSLDDGATWSAPAAVSQGAGSFAQSSKLAMDEQGNLHVAWEDSRTGDFNVFYSGSTDGGLSWSPDQQLNDTNHGVRVELLADEDGLHTAWTQYNGGAGWPLLGSSASPGILWYKHSADGGQSWSSEVRLSQNESVALIDMSSQGADNVQFGQFDLGFVAFWTDKRSSGVETYVRNNFYRASLQPTATQLSVATGGAVDFTLDGHENLANAPYIILGSLSGSAPGLSMPTGGTLPMNFDGFSTLILSALNTPNFQGFGGALDAFGDGAARFDTLSPLDPVFAGLTLTFAFAANNAPYGWVASNAVEVQLVP